MKQGKDKSVIIRVFGANIELKYEFYKYMLEV